METETEETLRTFEGFMNIKWRKNGTVDMRCITIDTKNTKTLNTELREIRRRFKDEQCEREDEGKRAYSVSFEMNERK